MATTSEVFEGLHNYAAFLTNGQDRLKASDALVSTEKERAKKLADDVNKDMSNLSDRFADIIATIGLFTPKGEFEAFAKDLLTGLITEGEALVIDAATKRDAIV